MKTQNTPTGAENTTAAQEDRIIRLPRMFYDDHQERDLPTPEAIRANAKSVWVSLDDPNLDELLDDAEYYAIPYGWGDGAERYHKAAVRLLAAYNDQVTEDQEDAQ